VALFYTCGIILYFWHFSILVAFFYTAWWHYFILVALIYIGGSFLYWWHGSKYSKIKHGGIILYWWHYYNYCIIGGYISYCRCYLKLVAFIMVALYDTGGIILYWTQVVLFYTGGINLYWWYYSILVALFCTGGIIPYM
jgi:hypothetical protein